MKTKTPRRPTEAPSRKRKRAPDDPEQFERFVEAARQAGVDETGQEFENAFAKITSSKRKKTL
jgi:hypothetical protein